MNDLNLTESNFEAAVLAYTAGPVLVEFFATWCGPCQMMLPLVKKLADDVAGTTMKVGTLNIDENPALAEKYGVMSIPTIIFFKNGQPVETLMGVQNPEALRTKLESLQ